MTIPEVPIATGLHKYYPVEQRNLDGCVPLHEHSIIATLAMMQRHVGHFALEIGTLYGEQTSNIARALPNHFVITVDLPANANPTHELDHRDLKYLGKTPTFPNDVIHRIEAMHVDSARLSLPTEVDLGFSFIDGSHSYAYAMSDFNIALKNSVNGAIIAFHDVGIFETVSKAVDELIDKHPTWEWYAYEGTSLVWLRVQK